MIKLFKIFVIFFLTQNIVFAMNNEKLSRLKWKAKTDIAIKAIQENCSKEDVGLEIDSEAGEQIFFSQKCKCAIKSGITEDKILAKNILDVCSL